MPGTEEPITEESIKALKADREKVKSNREKLFKLAEDLAKKEEQIDRIKRDIKDDLRDPTQPWGLDLAKDQEWDKYFEDADRLIKGKKNLDEIRKTIKGLEKERKDIEAQIVPLVPSSFHGIKIKVLNNQRTIKVDGEKVEFGKI